MKSKIGNKQLSPKLHHSNTPSLRRYSITKHIAFWHLTFNGQKACFDHEQGAYYVAYLLLNPPDEPIHGMALEIKSLAYFGLFSKNACETEIINPSTGETMILAADAILQQRNFALDDAASRRPLLRKIDELEAILENPHASEPVKAEVRHELLECYEWQQKEPAEILDEAQRAVRAVRRAINRFHKHIASALDPQGRPHPILRPFAAHLEKHLLIPTSRYSRSGQNRVREEASGTFTYEPPAGAKWTA